MGQQESVVDQAALCICQTIAIFKSLRNHVITSTWIGSCAWLLQQDEMHIQGPMSFAAVRKAQDDLQCNRMLWSFKSYC